MKVNAIVLFVRQFEACKKFYEDIMGLKVKNTDEGFVAFELEGDQELALMSVEAASQMLGKKVERAGAEGGLLGMFVENTDKTYDELKAKGVEFIKPPTTQPWKQRTAYLKDPDGHLWEISHFLSEEK